jgi:hypothetical protein
MFAIPIVQVIVLLHFEICHSCVIFFLLPYSLPTYAHMALPIGKTMKYLPLPLHCKQGK